MTTTMWSIAARNARLSADSAQVVSGFLDFYSGAVPANGDAAITGTLLCSIPLDATPFNAPSNGTMTNQDNITGTGTAGAGSTGTAATYAVLYKADHTTVEAIFTVGTSGAGINLPSTTITTGEQINIAAGAWTLTDAPLV